MASGTTTTNIMGTLSDAETNYLRAAHLIIHVCPKAVRKLFDSRHPPSRLTRQLAAQQPTLQKCKGIFKASWPLLFPPRGHVKSSDFDITLLMTLLRNFTQIPEPSTGWDSMPKSHDHSEGADLVRVRLYRNKIFHSNDAMLLDSEFSILWTELRCAIDRISGGTLTKEVDDLPNIVLDQTHRELLLKSIQHDNVLRSHEEEIKEIKREQSQPIPSNVREQKALIIKQWRDEDKVFFETVGYKGALALLSNKNYINIIGGPGTGKSATARHIALKLEDEGWEVIPVDDPEEIILYGSFDIKQVFVIDDVLGVFNVQMHRLDTFARKKQKLMNLMQNQTKLIMTCRKVVYNEAKKSKSPVTDFVVDLENSDFELKEDEKTKILLNHCTAAGISQELYENIALSDAKLMFPFLCKIFCNDKKYQTMGKIFFERSNECLLENLENLKERHKLQYASLVLLCLTKTGKLSRQTINENGETFLNIKKAVFDIYGINHGTPSNDIIDVLSFLDGTYTRTPANSFTFLHDSIFELVAYHHGKSYPEHILMYSSSSYVNNRVIVDGTTRDDSLYIKLERKYFPLLAKRILQDIKELKLYDVFQNASLKNDTFLDVFIGLLQETDFKTFKEIFIHPHPSLQKRTPAEDTFTRKSAKTENLMWNDIRKLLEKNDTRVIRWILFYGPSRLLEFVINHVREREGSNIVKRLAHQVTKKPTKLLFGELQEQARSVIIGCCSGEIETLKLILQHVNSSCVNKCINLYPWYTPLTAACNYYLLPVFDELYQNGAKLDVRDGDNNAPVHSATYRGHSDILMYLISRGVSINQPGSGGHTPLYIAARRENWYIVRLLTDHSANPNVSGYHGTPLYLASWKGHFDIIRYLIDYGADPNAPSNEYGNTPLHRATERGQSDIVRYLVNHGADANVQDVDGRTPLYVASERGHYDVVSFLLGTAADVKLCNHGDTSPLEIALYTGKMDIVRLLVKNGNNVKTNQGNYQLFKLLLLLKQLEVKKEDTSRRGRIIYRGSKRGRLTDDLWEIITERECCYIRKLLALGFDVNHCNEKGRSLLCRVIRDRWCEDKEKKVKLLLEAGADVNIRDKQCVSVIEHTRRRVCENREGMKRDKCYESKFTEYCNVLNILRCCVQKYDC